MSIEHSKHQSYFPTFFTHCQHHECESASNWFVRKCIQCQPHWWIHFFAARFFLYLSAQTSHSHWLSIKKLIVHTPEIFSFHLELFLALNLLVSCHCLDSFYLLSEFCVQLLWDKFLSSMVGCENKKN